MSGSGHGVERRSKRAATRFPHPDTPSHRSGFTLIEILVVIVVIAVLAALVAPNVFRHVGSAKDAAARSQIEMLGAALAAPVRPRAAARKLPITWDVNASR